MHKIIIHKLGPIERAEIDCRNFMLFTGSQASGKSTAAKVIYFFKTVKDDMMSLIIRRATSPEAPDALENQLKASLRNKFLQIFGSSRGMDRHMRMECRYAEDTHITIRLTESSEEKHPNFISPACSENITNYLRQKNDLFPEAGNTLSDDQKNAVQKELRQLFDDPHSSVYIPAGRSMITLLGSQLNYIYATMEDDQKRMIDLCTRNYLETIMRIKPAFENGLPGLMTATPTPTFASRERLEWARKNIEKVLMGSYKYNNDDERLEMDNGRYVKINFASSGQQEIVWILNLLYYYLLHGRPTFLIIEEPESHLFPEAQAVVSELIALFANTEGNGVLVTTHSPYVLGSINNLLYAGQLSPNDSVDEIVDARLWLDGASFNAWFLRDGKATPCIDRDINLIQNELIDEISGSINEVYDKLQAIQWHDEGEE